MADRPGEDFEHRRRVYVRRRMIQFKEGKEASDLIELNLLTAASPTSSNKEDEAVVCPISTQAPTDGYWISMIVDSGAGESVSPSDAFLDLPNL